MLDRGRAGQTQPLAFHRIGNRVAIGFENPRFRNAAAPGAASPDFATSIVWMGPVARTLAGGRLVVDIAPFLATDVTGIAPRIFDPRIGGCSTQKVDHGAPLGRDVVSDYANRFRLEKLDPAAPRPRARRPIVFYVDRAAPEPIRPALIEGIGWWASAFEAAGWMDGS